MTRLSLEDCAVNDASALNHAVGLRSIVVKETTLNGFDCEMFNENNSECSYRED